MNKKRFAFIYPLLVAGSFLVGRFAFADVSSEGSVGSILDFNLNPGDWIARLLGNIFHLIFIQWLGQLLLLLMDGMISVASYNGFLDAQAVQIGWPLVRDLANMFFVLGLLIIAIGTILGAEEYKISHLLPRFVLMAVLINFSKGITGFLIDVSQLIMLTFVNAFKDTTVANLTSGFGLTKLLTLNKELTEQQQQVFDAGAVDVLIAILLAAFMMFGATLVMMAMLVFLILRTLALWVLIILSPLAFMLSIFSHSSAGEFAQKWWKELIRYLMVGPILAFFMWLAFAVIANYDAEQGNIASNEFRQVDSNTPKADQEEFKATISEAGTTTNLLNFFIVIGLLLVGLKEAAEMGTEGSHFAEGAYERLRYGLGAPIKISFGQGEKAAGFGKEALGGFLGRKGAEWSTKGGALGLVGKAMTLPKALPEAFHHYEEQRNREVMPQVVGKYQDIMNRMFNDGRETHYGEENFIKAVREREEEMSEGEPDAEEFGSMWIQAGFSKSKVEKQAAQRKVTKSRFEDDMIEAVAKDYQKGGRFKEVIDKLDSTGQKYQDLRKGSKNLAEWQLFLREWYYGNIDSHEAEELAGNAVAYAESEGKIRGLGLAHVEDTSKGFKMVWSSRSETGKNVQAVDMNTGDALFDAKGKEVMVGHQIDLAQQIQEAGERLQQARAGGNTARANTEEKIIEHWRDQMGELMGGEAVKRIRRGSAERWAESFEAAAFRIQTGSYDDERARKYGKFAELDPYGKSLLRKLPRTNVTVIDKVRKTQPRLVDIAGFTPYTKEAFDVDAPLLEAKLRSDPMRSEEDITGVIEGLYQKVGTVTAEAVKPELLLEVIARSPEFATQAMGKLSFSAEEKIIVKEKIIAYIRNTAPGQIATLERKNPRKARAMRLAAQKMEVWANTTLGGGGGAPAAPAAPAAGGAAPRPPAGGAPTP
ncbi:MAG: hypothetical protein Q7S89_03595 [bacterium]|nr:hypothetical protein [bacterium]